MLESPFGRFFVIVNYMEQEIKKFQFWKVFIPLYIIFFFLIIFLGYGFPPDFKTWRFGIEEFLTLAFLYDLPLTLTIVFLIKSSKEELSTYHGIKTFIKETNGLSIFSFLTAIFAWILSFIIPNCGGASSTIGFVAALMGIVSLFWLKRKKEKGVFFAILGIVIGILASIWLMPMC